MRDFIKRWLNHGDEKSETQTFWLEFLHDVLNVENPTKFIEFEKRVELAHKSFIDGYIPLTRAIIEQKSIDVNLEKSAKQSDGSLKTPFEQAKRYSDWLPDSERARWIITCNFQEFHIHDMERPKAKPEIIKLENLEKEWRKFLFLIDLKALSPKEIHEEEISIKAGELVGKLYDALKERYQNPDSENSLRSLNILCVRIVFLLYAEDSGLFNKSQFHDFLKKQNNPRRALIDLFEVLAQKIHERDFYLDDDLKNFPYVNGGLFEEKNIEIPNIDGEPLKIILEDMSESFDWEKISPAIFGALFESTLNPDTRRKGGMHYTSIENIHKVIDPLFLDELNEEFIKIRSKEKLKKFREKISSLKFFDPACGSGNFLTETYECLSRLEIKIIEKLNEFPMLNVNINQFYGIEINDFAVAVAKTALWISSIQMAKECNPEIDLQEKCLPLEKYENIIKENSLKFNWAELVTPDFIMGNPPFVGYSNQTKEQKEEILSLYVDENGKPYKSSGKIDYVAGWYFKAAEFIKNTNIKAAFVSTNSITQGEQVSGVFKPLAERFNIKINFAYKSFVWSNEASEKAHVHCVIIGFSAFDDGTKKIFDGEKIIDAKNINFYLVDADNVFIEARQKPICIDAPEMKAGGKPAEGGNLILTSEEKDELLKANPKAEKFIRPFMGANDFLQRKPRYCLWLVGANPDDIKKCPLVMKRIEAVKNFRLASKKEATKRKAETPTLFDEIVEMKENYIVIPETSSGERFYIPIDWLDASIIPNNALRIISNANLYQFGILTSSVHMAWMSYVCGRLGSGYRYSITIVYNNFIWPSPTEKQKSKIENAAKKILEARAKYPESSFASLYNDDLMPVELKKAHKENDLAVIEAYGFEKNISEEKIVSELMKVFIIRS